MCGVSCFNQQLQARLWLLCALGRTAAGRAWLFLSGLLAWAAWLSSRLQDAFEFGRGFDFVPGALCLHWQWLSSPASCSTAAASAHVGRKIHVCVRSVQPV